MLRGALPVSTVAGAMALRLPFTTDTLNCETVLPVVLTT